MCGMGFNEKAVCYIPTPKQLKEFIDAGYKYILLKNIGEYDVFTLLRLKSERNDGYFLLETTNGEYLVLDKWSFAEHTWENIKVGWRGTYYGSIKFIFD